MSSVLTLLLAVGVLASLAIHGLVGYRLWQLGLDFRQLDEDFDKLHKGLKAVQPERVDALHDRVDELATRQRHLAHHLGWVKAWVEWWAAPTEQQEAGQ